MARWRRMPFLWLAAIGCLGLAAASLVLPSGPTYDPYAWLIWGRELAHLDLATTGGGAAWKPLPALIDAVLSPLGGGAASGWVVVARAGALFAVLMAGRLAWRLTPRGARPLAALAAAATLVLTHEYLKRNGVADAEGLMVALGLLAVDRHLDGHRGQAFALVVAAGLIRVEAWPFVAAYGVWLWHRSRSARTLAAVAAGGLLIPVLWFGGDWLGSGRLFSAAGVARHPAPDTPGASVHPFSSVLSEAWQMVPLPAWVAIGVALASLMMVRRESRANRAVAILATCAGAWILVVAAMATRGYWGLPRFLFMADGLAAVVAGVGVGRAIAAARVLAERSRPSARVLPRLATAVAALAVAAAFAYGSVPNAQLLPTDAAAIDKVADMDSSLAHAIHEAGGSGAILRCGLPTTPWYSVTALAYDLRVAATRVHDRPLGPRPVVFHPERGVWDIHASDCPAES